MFKRTLLALAVGLTLAAGVATAETQIYYGFNIGITNAPPPPRLVFREEPEVVVVPGTTVYVVDREDNDCDMFRCGPYYYASRGGYWYRARTYRGPFMVIDVRRVPRSVFSVPSRHWRYHPHGGPPGLTKRYDDHGHGHGHGNGKHGHDDD